MPDPELGAKQICPACSSKFYDLRRRPAECPKCHNQFDPEELLRSRRARVRPLAPEEPEEAVAVAAVEGEEEAEVEAAPELDQVVDEPVLISDDDDEAVEPDAAEPAPAEALGVDFAEEDDLETADDDEVPFIEEDDEAFPEDEIDGLPADGDREDR